MKGQLVCLLLVLVFASVLSQTVQDRYRHFVNQHVYGQMRVNRCDEEIRRRGITEAVTNACKDTNTFILAPTNMVKDICGRAGEPYGNRLRKSLQPFNVIVCKLRNQVRPPRCEYRGQDRTRRIVIACEDGFPVHFAEDVIL